MVRDPAFEFAATLFHASEICSAGKLRGCAAGAGQNPLVPSTRKAAAQLASAGGSGCVTLFLAGDGMTGRGIDQILPSPLPSEIAERGAKSARGYIELAERANGPLPPRASVDYIWGDALRELDARGKAGVKRERRRAAIALVKRH